VEYPGVFYIFSEVIYSLDVTLSFSIHIKEGCPSAGS
jgi:hypothetical protein